MFVMKICQGRRTTVITYNINTIDQLLHNIHNKLKYNQAYLNFQVNKRLDYYIIVLLCIEEDIFFNRQKKDLKWKWNRQEMKEPHRYDKGMKIP